MPFDNSVYLKIRGKYIENVNAFRRLGKNKITFNQKTGLFTQEGNFVRTFSFRNTEGTSASNKEGFLYPVVGLAYDACIRGLDSMKGISLRRQYLDDLATIESGLEELRRTYEDQWRNKQSQTTNVASARATCSKFKAILRNATAGQLQDSYLAANRLFMHETEYRSTYNFRDVVEFTRSDEEFNRKAARIIHIDENLKNQNYGANIEYFNPIFFHSVKKLSGRIYSYKYAASEENMDPRLPDPSQYVTAMTLILRSAPGHGYADVFYQGGKSLADVNTAVFNRENSGRFLYFKSAPPRPNGAQIGCRLYLNLKNDLETHSGALRELLKIISIDKWKKVVSDFKFTHLSSKRKDAVCIYGTDEKNMKLLADDLNPMIGRFLKPEVANMQRLIYPGIGMGVEPEIWDVESSDFAGRKNIQWSYGTHRSFLVTWGVIRARKSGIDINREDYVEQTLLQVSRVFEENGVDLQEGHAGYISFKNSQLGVLLQNENLIGLASFGL
jgi:hypothetical protein